MGSCKEHNEDPASGPTYWWTLSYLKSPPLQGAYTPAVAAERSIDAGGVVTCLEKTIPEGGLDAGTQELVATPREAIKIVAGTHRLRQASWMWRPACGAGWRARLPGTVGRAGATRAWWDDASNTVNC